MGTFASGKVIKLKAKLNPADTSLTADIDVGVTAGRLYYTNDEQEEWIDFTGVAASGSNFVYSGLTRGLSQTANPATAGTGLTWLAGNSGTLVAMHDQLIDNQIFNQLKQEGLTYATAAARDSDLGADGAATKAYTDIWVTADGLFYNYNLSSAQWEAVDTGTVTPNMSTTVAGKGELATQTQSDDGDNNDGGVPIVSNPETVGRSIQKQAATYKLDTGAADVYVLTLTPAPTAYVEGMIISVKISVVNTGASTINVNALGAKALQNGSGQAFASGELALNGTYNFRYDGTNFVLHSPEKANNTEATAGANNTKFITPKQAKDYYGSISSGQFNRDLSSATPNVQTIAHGLAKTPRKVTFSTIGNIAGGPSDTITLFGIFDGTNQFCQGETDTGAQVDVANVSGNVIHINDANGFGQVAVCSVDATNVTLTWTGDTNHSSTVGVTWVAES